MTYTTLLKWSIQRHVHDPTQRHAHGLINLEDVSYTTSCPWPSLPGIHAQYNGVPVTCITSIYHHLLVRLPPVAGSDPGFQVWGGAIQNIAPSGVRREIFLGYFIFFPTLGGGRGRRVRPPLNPPLLLSVLLWFTDSAYPFGIFKLVSIYSFR